MPITAFDYDSTNIIERHADVWILDDVVGTDWHQLGSLESVELNGDPKTSGPDTHGREQQTGVTVTGEVVMKQTSYATEFANLDALADPATNGHHIKITDCAVDPGIDQAATNTNVAAATGVELTGCSLRVGFGLVFNGDPSNITITLSGDMPMSEVVKLGNSAASFITC
jgi:hypothetical protein